MQLSFGMIFSIILIILFLILAFYGIRSFLNMKDTVQLKQFQENLELEIERLWKNPGTKTFGENNILPNDVLKVCLREPDILEVETKSRREKIELDHVEVVENFCVEPVNNKVSFTLSRGYNEGPFVKVTK